jgi:hypothetical protein
MANGQRCPLPGVALRERAAPPKSGGGYFMMATHATELARLIGQMSAPSPLWGVKRKSDLWAARSAFDP